MRKSLALFALSCVAGCGVSSGRNFLGVGGSPGDLAGASLDLGGPQFPTVDMAVPVEPAGDMAQIDNNSNPDSAFVDPCLARAKLIYTVDENNVLYSFTPNTLKFATIGQLNCPVFDGSTPFSMGVDHNAVAWVLYNNGSIFDVDTQTAQCKATNFAANQMGFDNFGMGFTADAAGSQKEHLYISGLDNSELGVIDPTTLKVSNVGAVNGTPELTGTGGGLLWAFFPDEQLPRVSQLDKATAKEGKSYPLNALAGTPSAWAFAFWGGDFWIFLEKDEDLSTNVYHLNSQTGQVTEVLNNTGYTIVGAGVSICAPVTAPQD